MTLNLASILRQAAKDHPTRPALLTGSQRLSYAELDKLARALAAGLAKLGLARGEKVALLLPNVPQFSATYFASHYGGYPVVPLNVLFTADEIAYHLSDSEAKVLVAWESFLEPAARAVARVQTCQHLIVAKANPEDTAAPEGVHNLALVMQSEPVAELAPTMPDDTAVILYTSGTTGKPKGAELTHFNLFYNSEYSATRLGKYTEQDVFCCVLPLFHSFAQTAIQNSAFQAAASIVLQPRFDPVEAMQAIQQHAVTVFAGVPTIYIALLNHPEADRYDLSSLRICWSGGSSMPVGVMRAFDERHGTNILEGYGLSETSPIASCNLMNRPKKAGSIGIPLSGVEFKLVDEREQTIAEPDTPGEICIKGHNVMKGYYKRPEATEQAISAEGWFRTGDIATRDRDGDYFIIDRKKDMLIRGGYNVYPREIEETLYAHPAIQEAAVIGVPHPVHGEEVKAVVAFKPGTSVTSEELIAYCKERLAPFKYPRIVEVRAALPKGPTGKVLKRELRA